MQMIRFMFKQFLREPMWFKSLIVTSLLITILFSSSMFPDNGYNQSISKIAGAVFFCTYGIKMRRNRSTSIIFFVLAALCIYLAWDRFEA